MTEQKQGRTARRLSVKQRELLCAVRDGRVDWRDPWPKLSARIGKLGTPTWHLDGGEAYGGQHATLDSLADRGLIHAVDGEPVVLTDAGRAVLEIGHGEE